MKFFLASLGMMILAIILFIAGALAGNGFVILSMCPGSLFFIWLNGYATRASGIRISITDDPVPQRQAKPVRRNVKKPVSEQIAEFTG